jgi:hypothetical protein
MGAVDWSTGSGIAMTPDVIASCIGVRFWAAAGATVENRAAVANKIGKQRLRLNIVTSHRSDEGLTILSPLGEAKNALVIRRGIALAM